MFSYISLYVDFPPLINKQVNKQINIFYNWVNASWYLVLGTVQKFQHPVLWLLFHQTLEVNEVSLPPSLAYVMSGHFDADEWVPTFTDQSFPQFVSWQIRNLPFLSLFPNVFSSIPTVPFIWTVGPIISLIWVNTSVSPVVVLANHYTTSLFVYLLSHILGVFVITSVSISISFLTFIP